MRGREGGPASFLRIGLLASARHGAFGTRHIARQESVVPAEDAITNRIRRIYCGAWRAVLLHGELATPVRFVLDARTGNPVLPVPRVVLDEESVTLCIPEDHDDALQVFGPPVVIDPARCDACDRYGAFFGRPEHTHWIMIDVESGRMGNVVFDGAALEADNPLHDVETALCRRLNADQATLAHLTNSPVARAVGVDRFGIHVRTRFDIARLEFPSEVFSVADANREIQNLLHRGTL
jgi:hypothetical protein